MRIDTGQIVDPQLTKKSDAMDVSSQSSSRRQWINIDVWLWSATVDGTNESEK